MKIVEFLITIIISYAIVWIPIILYLKKGWLKWWFHDVWGWHVNRSPGWSDGCSIHQVCKYCGREIMQDSQGNWFEI